jgi:hypothetical protein
MKTYLTYGLYLALAGFLLALLLFICGLQSDPAKLGLAQGIGFVVGSAVATILIVLGIRARRNSVPETEAFTYGDAFGAGFLIQLFGSLFGIVTTWLYGAVINPNLSDVMVQFQLNKLQAKGISGDQLDRAEHMMRLFSGPGVMAGFNCIGTLVVGTVIVLIVAAFCRREATEPPLAS